MDMWWLFAGAVFLFCGAVMSAASQEMEDYESERQNRKIPDSQRISQKGIDGPEAGATKKGKTRMSSGRLQRRSLLCNAFGSGVVAIGSLGTIILNSNVPQLVVWIAIGLFVVVIIGAVILLGRNPATKLSESNAYIRGLRYLATETRVIFLLAFRRIR